MPTGEVNNIYIGYVGMSSHSVNATIIFVLTGLLTGCGGGGGGGSSGTTNPTVPDPVVPVPVVPTPDPTPEPTPAPTLPPPQVVLPTEPLTAQHLLDIKAPQAWDRGYDGAGVTVAVLDTGILSTHSEFEGRISDKSTAYSLKYVLDGNANPSTTVDYSVVKHSNINDEHSHGTHVAGVIAGKTYGVAPEAEIMAIKVLTNGHGALEGQLFGSNQITYDAMKYAIQNGAKIINGSLTYMDLFPVDDAISFEAMLVNKDANIVAAAGNGSYNLTDIKEVPAQTGYYSPTHLSEVSKRFIYAGSVGSDLKTLSDFSSYPGLEEAIQRVYILAPAEVVTSASNAGDNETMLKTGTSMAAPMVSGGLALLRTNWKNLSSVDAASILLQTANKSFAGYNPFYHGQGVLDLEKATRPVGVLSNNKGISVASTYVVTDSGVASALRSSKTLQNNTQFDAYKRNYSVDVTGLIKENNYGEMLSSFYFKDASYSLYRNNHLDLSAADVNPFNMNLSNYSVKAGSDRLAYFTVSNYALDNGKGKKLGFNHQLSLNEAGYSFRGSSKNDVSVSFPLSTGFSIVANNSTYSHNSAFTSTIGAVNSRLGFNYTSGNSSVSFGHSSLSMEGLFNSNFNGQFNNKNNWNGLFLSYEHKGVDYAILAGYSAYTGGNDTVDGSLSFSNMSASSFYAGGSKDFDFGKIGLMVSSPLSVDSGNINLRNLVKNSDGLTYSNVDESVAFSSAKIIDVELMFSRNFNSQEKVSINYINRSYSDSNLNGAMVSYQRYF